MKDKVLRDYLGAKLVINNCVLDYYGKIYSNANENLIDIYLDQDFEDKDVLSVVSSSDQIYTPKLLGAKHVDGFDKNRLTKYYYYMRKWVITYNNQLYPYRLFDGDLNYLAKIIDKVEVSSKNEQDALDFWKCILKEELEVDKLFYYDMVNNGCTLFDNNIKYVKDICLDDLNFTNLDFFEEINSKKKYDYILMSNILEYCRAKDFKVVRDNLYNLLNDNGKVICSRLIYKKVDFNENELDTFDELFDFEDYGSDEGYIYKKRQKIKTMDKLLY